MLPLHIVKSVSGVINVQCTFSLRPRSMRLLGVSGRHRLPIRSTMAGTAAKPTDRRQPHSCILEVPARANQQTSYSQVAAMLIQVSS